MTKSIAQVESAGTLGVTDQSIAVAGNASLMTAVRLCVPEAVALLEGIQDNVFFKPADRPDRRQLTSTVIN